MATLWNGDEVVGEVTSGAWGYRVGHSVALGMVRPDLASAGTELMVDIYGHMCPATVETDGALWDPKNERIRA